MAVVYVLYSQCELVINHCILKRCLSGCTAHVASLQASSEARSSGGAISAAVLMADPSELPMVSLDFSLSARFPQASLSEALAFFSAPLDSPLDSDSELPEGTDDSNLTFDSVPRALPSTDGFSFAPPLASLCTG